MDLWLDMGVAEGYRSKSQIARRISEDWASRNMYCLDCASDRLIAVRPNAPVLDYVCPECEASYQLKAKKSSFGRTVTNSAYDKKIRAIEEGRVPHYAFLRYSSAEAQVTDLFVIPRHLFHLGMISPRNRLSSGAKRSGWQGSKILLDQLTEDARIDLVSKGKPRDPSEARADWNRYTFLQRDVESRGGWGADILMCVQRLCKERGARDFTLQQFNARFLGELQLRYPKNHHVADKVRQQLQVLRDAEILEFVTQRGDYRLSD